MTEHEKDILFQQIKECLKNNGYYAGDSAVADVLRQVADYWDD